MPNFICVTCGAQYADSAAPPEHCAVCEDERQYVGWDGQRWTTLKELQAAHTQPARRRRPGADQHLVTEPKFAIGQRALHVRTAGRQRPLGLHQPDRRRERLGHPGARRRRGHRHLPSALLLVDGRVEPRPGRRAGLPPRGRRRLGHAAHPADRLLAGRHPRARARAHPDPLRRPLPRQHGAALGRRRRRAGRAPHRRHHPGGPGSQDRELHVQLSRTTSRSAPRTVGRSWRRSSRSSSIRSMARGSARTSSKAGKQAFRYSARPLPRAICDR